MSVTAPLQDGIEFLITRARLLALVQRPEGEAVEAQVTSTVRLPIVFRLAEDVKDRATRRALTDALTRELPHRFEDGYNVEDARFEPGTSEWIGWVIGNADRIEVEDGAMLADLDAVKQRKWFEDAIAERREVKQVRVKR